MALTYEEELELAALEAEEARYQDSLKGQDAVQHLRGRQKPQLGPRPFSLWRTTVGGLRDAAQGFIDTAKGLYLEAPLMPTPLHGLGAARAALDTAAGRKVVLPQPQGSEDAGTV